MSSTETPRHEKPYGMDEPAHASPLEEAAALRHLSIVALALIGCALVSYLVPGMRAVRPWESGEGAPIVRLFLDEEPVSELAIATGGAAEEEAESGLDETALANLEEEERAPPPPEPDPIDPSQRVVRIDPSELEGLSQRIEDPSGAMRAFHEQLLRTARGEARAITRVAHFGDSSIALDGITQTVRRDLQRRFGDAGHGWILASRGSLPYRHHDVRHDSSDDHWQWMDITHLPLEDGRYGLGGYQFRSVHGGTAFFQTADESSPNGRAVSRFEVFYQRHPRGGRFEIRVDGGEPAIVDTEGEPVSDEVYRIAVPDGPHRFDLRTIGHGQSRLYGVVLERDGPGVVYDSLGMVGARASRFLGFERDHLRRQLELRGTHLVVIGYGGNDADDDRTQAQFENDFRRVARLVREAAPGVSCLLFAPLDQAERDERGHIRTLPQVPRIVEAMRSAARAEGCAFYDTFAAMGGEGGMARWHRSRPRLAFGDLRHATPAGYRVLGNMFYKALLADFADHLARR